MSGDRLSGQVKLVSSLTRSGSSRGQSDSIVNAIRLRLEDAGHRVGGVPVVSKPPSMPKGRDFDGLVGISGGQAPV
jgi:hypothetical protein